MIDDFRPERKIPKRIEPLDKPIEKSIHDLLAEHKAANATEDDLTPEIPEANYKMPEAIEENEANTDDTYQPVQEEAADDTPTVVHHEKAPHRFLNWRWRLSKKWTIIAGAAAVLIVGTAATFAYANQPHDTGGTFASKKGNYVPKVTTVASNLTGLQVDSSINQRPVTGIMIENSVDARPQSGLDQAGIVFEAIAEGGITRFLALFQDNQTDYVGPVRSVRPYYLQWCMSFDCAIGHVGGSPEALSNIKTWGVKDLDQFYNSGAYKRISSRYAPHNVYTNITQLNQVEASKGFGAASYTPLPRKTDSPSTAPNAATVNLAISSAQYNVTFAYDAVTNSYKRSEGGAAHMVVNSAGQQTQISPKVVVALVMQYGVASDHHSQYNVTGSGQAFVFQDGVITTATWSKTDNKAPIVLTGADNQPVKLNAGQTWFTAVGGANLVTYR
jgi:hypothetical protein